MIALKDVGFVVRSNGDSREGERRLEVRLAKGDEFVAWFQCWIRESAGDPIVSTNTQFVARKGLSKEQFDAVKEWLRHQSVITTY